MDFVENPKRNLERVQHQKPTLVIIDLETTGLITGFVDSWLVFRQKYPGRSCKQVDLARTLLHITYDAHNAEADVQTLAKLVGLCTTSELLSFRFSPKDIMLD
ncbi:uncharacterized protein LOC127859308 isoform X5 [Dreissena polymorpha]|uniref:uncharacterized protein LOC127859308 isoform X5 n=1 Tax=Dreissena polymorpha TaxID=45954 RepID=UPI0022650ADF|nr:uncharacterized protein LOC127859308 isoform X5 [Dreissena polymorpha]